jgi:hypothetical protein
MLEENRCLVRTTRHAQILSMRRQITDTPAHSKRRRPARVPYVARARARDRLMNLCRARAHALIDEMKRA